MHWTSRTGLQEKPFPGTRSKCRPGYFSIRRASTFFWLMSNFASWPCSRNPFAKAIPGERCLPVPPQEIRNRLMRKPPDDWSHSSFAKSFSNSFGQPRERGKRKRKEKDDSRQSYRRLCSCHYLLHRTGL